MGQIFLSYARKDLERARTVATALQEAGFSVWWDRKIVGGSEYSREIEQALNSAAAVVVLWSRSSVDSPWVRDEAAKGRDSGRLVPATLDGTEPPLGFGQLHTIDLRRQLRGPSEGLRAVVAAIEEKVTGGSPGSAANQFTKETLEPISLSKRVLNRPLAGIVSTFLLVLVVAASVYLLDPLSLRTPTSGAGDGGTVAISRFEPMARDPETQRVARLAGDAVERTFATNFIKTLVSRSASAAALRDADFSLSGTVDRQGTELTAAVTITDTGSGQTLWSTERTRSADEGRQLANELSIWVADVLRCAIYAKSRMQKYGSAEVESRILRWCEAERSRGDQFDQMPGIANELVTAAPESGQAHAYLALGLVLAQPERRDEIYAAARKALQLEPENGVARVALAAVPDPAVRLAERERLYREAMRLDPDFMYSRAQLAFLMMTLGRTEEAKTLLGELVSAYPLDYFQRGFWAFQLAQSGDLRRAREEYARIEQLRPGWRVSVRDAIQVELLFGDPQRARPLIERSFPEGKDRKCIEFVIDARLRKRSPSAEQISSNCPEGSMFGVTMLNGFFGNVDEVYRRLDRDPASFGAIPRFGPRFLYYPQLASVRADPRLMPSLARLGYPQYWLETGKWPDFCREERLPYNCRRAAQDAVTRLR